MEKKNAAVVGRSSLLMLVAFAVGLTVAITQKGSAETIDGKGLMPIDGGIEYPSWVDPSKWDLLQAATDGTKPDAVVAQDGSGTHKSIQDAIDAVPMKNNKNFVILVKAGMYKEYVHIPATAFHVVLIGEGPAMTTITGNKNVADGIGTYHTATVAVEGNYFMAKGITFENSAGAIKQQAAALRVNADSSILYNCHINGYQDTLYTYSNRQFYRNCIISGTIDFIFGDAQAVFQKCTMLIRKPQAGQDCVVTAQGRDNVTGKGATVLQNCIINGTSDFMNAKPAIKAYLGRPWKAYSRTIIMQSFIGAVIDPAGWTTMDGVHANDTCFYAEFNNTGAGANMNGRVQWHGIKTITLQDAQSFTPGSFIDGDSWIKPTGIPYDSGIIKVSI